MAYGGAGPASLAPAIKQVKLERESELRIEVGNDAPLRLRLLNGTAEIFGTELPPEIWLNFPPWLKFPVCRLSIQCVCFWVWKFQTTIELGLSCSTSMGFVSKYMIEGGLGQFNALTIKRLKEINIQRIKA